MKASKMLFALFGLVMSSVRLLGQTEPNLANGFIPFGSYHGSSIDSVNLMNGNLVNEIPFPQDYPQRGSGLKLNLAITLNGKGWTVNRNPGGNMAPVWEQNPYWMGPLQASNLYPMFIRSYEYTNSSGFLSYGPTFEGVVTPDGHQFGGDPDLGLTNDSGWKIVDTASDGNGVPTSGYAIDGAGNQYPFTTWADRCQTTTENGFDGAMSTTTCNGKAYPTSVIDPNGNTYTFGSSGSPDRDTLGRTFSFSQIFTTTSDYSGCVSALPISSAAYFSYPAANGTTHQIKMCYSAVGIQTAFNASGVSDVTGLTQSMPVTMILQDGSKWTFTYDGYLNITSIGLPLGGSISYQWITVPFPSYTGNVPVSRAVSQRTITDNNGHSYLWKYQWMTQQNNAGTTGGTYTNIVTDPLGNDSVHVFMNYGIIGFYETSALYYQGSQTSGKLLKEVDTGYQTSINNIPAGHAWPTSIQTTVYPSGKISLVTNVYDPSGYGKVVTEKVYDWGQNPSAALLRETDNSYEWQVNGAYLNAHLINLPATVIVKDGGGCTLSETDYTYDEPVYLSAYTGTLPTGTHVAAPNSVRGNLTSVTRWLAPTSTCNPKGGTPIVTHTKWYDTGETYQQIDALGKATTHSYDPAYAGAYSTQTCSPSTNGVAHCVSGTYDFNTGLLTSFTNENASSQTSGTTPGDSAHTINYAYDFMSRMTSATFPPDPNNGGALAQTSFSYSPGNVFPFTVTRTKSITPSLTDSVTSTYDGLGRVYKTQHALPNGTAEVDTVYDGLDHIVSVTNPYFSTGDSTYGLIQTQYDALGRVTQVTKQDGSVTTNAYEQTGTGLTNSDCTTTTDESGRSRRICSDALGRLVEVDEPQASSLATNATATVTISGLLQGGAAPPPAASGTPLVSFADSNGGQHWAYFDANHHVYNLFWSASSGYGFFDATAETGAPPAAAGSALAGFGDPSGGLHWSYFDSNGHVYNLWWISGASRGANDVTGSVGAAPAVSGSPLSAFKDVAGGQHWAYFDANRHVWNLYFGNGAYGNGGDVTAATGAPAAVSGSGLAAFGDTQGGQHWAYLDANQHVWNLYWVSCCGYGNGGDVTSTVGAPAAASGSPVAAFGDVNAGQHWTYLDGSHHAWNLYWTPCCGYGNGGDVTATVGGPSAAASSGLTAFGDINGGQYWAYLAANGHVSNLSWTPSSGYGQQDPTAASGAPTASSAALVSGFSDWSDQFVHWDFIGAGQHVFQIWGQGTAGPYGYSDINNSTSLAFDSGLVSLTVGNFTATACFGPSTNPACTGQPQNTTAAQVAAALAQAINVPSSPAAATASGPTISLTWRVPGADTPSVTALSTTHDNLPLYPNPSFTSAPATFSGGTNSSLSSPYVTLYSYDALGNLLQVNQKGDGSQSARVRSFTYDSLSRLLTATNPETGTTSYTYDANGNVLQKTSPAPNQTGSATQTISYCYDALNRVTGKGYSAQSCPLSSPVVTYGYDSGTNGIGKLTSLTDQAGSATYTYDVLGRMTGETRVISGVSKSMTYAYNLDGSLKTLTNPSGAVITYTPDSAGRDVSAVDNGNGINYVTGATYGPDSSLTGFISGQGSSFSGITNLLSYNHRLQPVSMSAVSPSQAIFSLNYDFHFGTGDNGNVFGITNNKDAGRNQTLTYDSLNRLTSAQNAGTDCSKTTVNGKTEYWGNSYGYDAWGNLLQKNVTKCSAEYLQASVSANNQLVGYTYDAAGNMTSDPTDSVTATYDQENRIATATKSGVSTNYTYDADGNRVEKSSSGTTTLYWYMSPGIVAESDQSGNLKSEYVFFNGERVARRDNPAASGPVFYYFSDHLKTTDIVTDAQGNILNESDFYPWGGELQFLANDPNNHYKFTGKERDSETGLDYFGARYYSNGLGRFITPDWAAKATAVPYAEFGDPQTLNLYSYVRNLPTTRFDADGHIDTETDLLDFAVVYTASLFPHPWQQFKDAMSDIGDQINQAVNNWANQQRAQCGCGGAQENQWQRGSEEEGKGNNNVSQSKNTSDVQANRKAGLDYEKRVLNQEGVSKNTKPMKATDPKTGKEGTTIPDGVRENGQTVESKGGKSVSDSPQLRRQTEVSQQSGQKPQVIVKPGTKVSKTVRERMHVKEQK